MFEINQSGIVGYMELQPKVRADSRGFFVKTFHDEFFRENGLATDFREQYYSYSKRNVLRGMHFQLPPHDHAKVVYCVDGEVLDVAVDLRRSSPTYGKNRSVVVSAARANIVYLESGLAHGFFVLSESALLAYSVTTIYAPAHDTGIRWDTCGINWPTPTPILSERDQSFQSLAEFDSPF